MTVSLIICTRNRAASLRSTLASIHRANIPEGWKVELIVVDNASTDDTRAVVEAARLDPIAVRYVREPNPGLSNARNAGLKLATGGVIMATDDDVRVPVDWFAGMCRPIIEGRADAIAGGVLLPPEVETALDAVPLEARRAWFGGTRELAADSRDRMIGANMAFHRRVLDQVPGFDAELGAGALGYGEETLFSYQLKAAGYAIARVFDVAVEHHFDVTRLDGANLMAMARKMGRSDAFIRHHWEHGTERIELPRMIVYHLRLRWVRLFGIGKKSSRLSLTRVLDMEEYLGFIQEYIVQRKRPWKYPASERGRDQRDVKDQRDERDLNDSR